MSFLVGFLEEFENYCEECSSRGHTHSSLEEYIYDWVIMGKAAKACGGDFQLFMTLVAFLFAWWHDRRTKCTSEKDWRSWIPWSVTRALQGDEEPGTEIFNPLFFQYFAAGYNQTYEQ